MQAANKLLRGGVMLEQTLAFHTSLLHFLPQEEVVREMDLVQAVFIVHRGSVVVSHRGQDIARLTKVVTCHVMYC